MVGSAELAWLTRGWKCAAQRLMQALGAYGNLGRNLGKTEFLRFIPIALPRLIDVLSEGNLLPNVRDVLQQSPATLHQHP